MGDSCCGELPGCGAAVHDEGLACDVGGCWGGEEDHDPFEVLWVAEAVERDALQHPGLELLDQATAHTGREPARGYGVDGDAVRGPRGRKITGHGDDGAFGGVVAHGLHVVGVAAYQAGHARDVDDGAPGPAFDHAPPRRLGHEERPPHVDPEYLVEALQGHLRGWSPPRGPAVVDDYVQTPESLFGLRHDSLDIFRICDVTLDGQRPAASGLYLAPHFFEGFDLARAQHDAGPGVGEGLRHVAAQPAASAGDDGRPAVETEEVECVQSNLLPDYAGSAVVFRRSSSARTRRRSLPTADLGNSSRNSTALTVSPRYSSWIPMATASATASCSKRTSSTSRG